MSHRSISYGGIADTAVGDGKYCHQWWKSLRLVLANFSHGNMKYCDTPLRAFGGQRTILAYYGRKILLLREEGLSSRI